MRYNQYKKHLRPYTDKQIINDYNSGLTILEISKKYSIGKKIVQRDIEKLLPKRRKAYKRNQIGKNNSYWKGGITKKNKYIYLRIPEHPNAGKNGYVAEHVVVACKKYNLEKIPKDMVVHHIDLDKTNNQLNNLYITRKKDHNALHWNLQQCAIELMKQGKIEFNETKGYIICG